MSETHKAFFYGTLMHPEILKRVIGNDGSHLEICPAVLMASNLDVHNDRSPDWMWIIPGLYSA
jgi:hypothetical protein